MKRKDFEQPAIENETMDVISSRLFSVTAELIAANQKLEQIQKERSEMLANISHDLRAPITAIRSAVDYLISGKNVTREDYESSVRLIDRRTAVLEALVQDMYYLFGVEDTGRELSLQTVDAALFLEEYFYDAIADAQYGKHELRLEIAESVCGKITMDIQKIVRVLDNLLTNAVKYSAVETEIVLKAECSAGRRTLQVSVVDQGIGISEDALEHIFERTYRVQAARTPGAVSGSGLGLSIVRAIVERHKGRVWCESVEGAGSRFSFEIPMEEDGV